MMHLVCYTKKKHKFGTEVLAAGGRYDTIISNFRETMDKGSLIAKSVPQSGVGISISLDKLVQTLQKEQTSDNFNLSSVDVLICSFASEILQKEKIKVSYHISHK